MRLIEWSNTWQSEDVIVWIKEHVIWFGLWLHLNETICIKNVHGCMVLCLFLVYFNYSHIVDYISLSPNASQTTFVKFTSNDINKLKKLSNCHIKMMSNYNLNINFQMFNAHFFNKPNQLKFIIFFWRINVPRMFWF